MHMRETNPSGGLRAAIAEVIRVEMARKRMTQRALAEATGLSQSYLGRRMVCEYSFTTDELERIAIALDVPAISLFAAEEGNGTVVLLALVFQGDAPCGQIDV